MDRPYEWDFHLATWVTLVIAVTLVILGHRRLFRTSAHPIRWTRHDIWMFAGGMRREHSSPSPGRSPTWPPTGP